MLVGVEKVQKVVVKEEEKEEKEEEKEEEKVSGVHGSQGGRSPGPPLHPVFSWKNCRCPEAGWETRELARGIDEVHKRDRHGWRGARSEECAALMGRLSPPLDKSFKMTRIVWGLCMRNQ
jgi:hypothetical protein